MPFLKNTEQWELFTPIPQILTKFQFFIFLGRSRHGASNAVNGIQIRPVVLEIDGGGGGAESAPPHTLTQFWPAPNRVKFGKH